MSNEIFNESDEKGSLTVEKLREFEGFENISDKEAGELINTYRQFSLLTYEFFNRQILNNRL